MVERSAPQATPNIATCNPVSSSASNPSPVVTGTQFQEVNFRPNQSNNQNTSDTGTSTADDGAAFNIHNTEASTIASTVTTSIHEEQLKKSWKETENLNRKIAKLEIMARRNGDIGTVYVNASTECHTEHFDEVREAVSQEGRASASEDSSTALNFEMVRDTLALPKSTHRLTNAQLWMLISIHNDWMMWDRTKQSVEALPHYRSISTESANLLKSLNKKENTRHALRLIWEEVRLRTGKSSPGAPNMVITRADLMNGWNRIQPLYNGKTSSSAQSAVEASAEKTLDQAGPETVPPFNSPPLPPTNLIQQTPIILASPSLATSHVGKRPLTEEELCERALKRAKLISELPDAESCIEVDVPGRQLTDMENLNIRAPVKRGRGRPRKPFH
jgi:hypothetical protein